MDEEPRLKIHVTRRFNSLPEHVFDAWLEPQTASAWLFATPAGKMIKAEIVPRVGGKFTFIDRREEGDIKHTGEYLEIERPRHLIFTFSVPDYSKENTRVMVDIVPAGMGCELSLTHEGVLPEYAEQTKEGWTIILRGLAKTLGE